MLPSQKYKTKLLSVKKKLMWEIAMYFKYGKFEMLKECAIPYQMDYGDFVAHFDTIRGGETDIKLYLKECDFITVIGFDANDSTNVEKDIPFLMSLLDYIDIDYRNIRTKS